MSASELALRTRFSRVLVPDDAADEDTRLVERFRQGERVAFEQLVRKYQKPIYFFILRHVPDADEAQELTQRAFIKAFGGLAGFRGQAAFRSWLYRIAVNLALNHIRDQSKFARDVELEERPESSRAAVDQRSALIRKNLEVMRSGKEPLLGKR